MNRITTPVLRIAAPLAERLDGLCDGPGARRAAAGLLVRPDVLVLHIEEDWVLQIGTLATSLPPFGLQVDLSSLADLGPVDHLSVESGQLVLGEAVIRLAGAERIDCRLGASRQLDGDTHLPEEVATVLRPGLGRLRTAIAGGDDAAILEAAHWLAGRGPGLTPAGDDVLLGLILAWGPERRALAEKVVENVCDRTTTLSRAWLEAAARGEVGEVWQRFLESEGEDRARTRLEVEAWGSTSGRCALVGFGMVRGPR